MRGHAANRASYLQSEALEGSLNWLLMPYLLFGSLLAILDSTTAPPPSLTGLGMLILVLCALVYLVSGQSELAATWLLALGSLALVFLTWKWFPDAQAYALLLLPLLLAIVALGVRAALLVTTLATAGLIIATVVIAASPALVWTTAGLLWVSAFFLIMWKQSQSTMLADLWRGYEENRRHLEEARDRQVQLKQALEDLDLASREVLRLNDLLTAAREAVEEARRAKEEFVANVSHELRTPLNMIIGFSDEILRRPQFYAERLPADLLEDIGSIHRNSTHLANLVDDVLDLVEADTGFTRLTKDWTSMTRIIQEAAEAVGIFFERKRIQLSMDLPASLPPIYCDHMRIRQVVLNLLSNAARFTQEGQTRVTVLEQDNSLIVQIADTGPGMDKEMIQHLFEPFQQGDPSTRRRYGGTGLGLAISRRFLEMHGGRIWIDSELGRGTTVSFSLPLQQQEIVPTARRWFSPHQEYAPRTRPSLAPIAQTTSRVVVHEQGEILSSLIRRYLPALEVSTVRGDELQRVLRSEAIYALVFNQEKNTDSVEWLANMPRLPFDVPIISCHVPERDVTTSCAGIQEYLVKPIRRAELLASIVRVAPAARRVLLVEDDEEARQLFGRMLADASGPYQVQTAVDGVTALRLMREWQPDLVLLDLVLPGQDGFAVLAAKAEDEQIRDTPVIVISAKDPQHEPIVSSTLYLTRQQGLSGRDLVMALGAIISALPPRFGAPARSASPAPSSASG